MDQSASLLEYAETFKSNFDKFRTSFPETFFAGEKLLGVLGSFSQELLGLRSDLLWPEVVRVMLFGCSASWAQSFISTASGLDELGMSSIRRSIEFTCYIAKIVRTKDKDRRAEIWRDKRSSDEAQKTFAKEFSVPRCYLSDNYSDLHELLVVYEHASDFAVHANLSMVASKTAGPETDLKVVFFDDPKEVPVSTSNMLVYGKWMILSQLAGLKQWISNYPAFEGRYNLYLQQESKCKLEVDHYYEHESISPELRAAMSPPNFYIDDELKKLKLKYSAKPPPASPPS